MTCIIEKDFNIKNLTTFKIGGKISKIYFPQNIDDLIEILNKTDRNTEIFGNLSNTLISSDGYNKPIILTTKMSDIKIEGTHVVADAGVKGPKLSQIVCEEGLSGLEFMIGFPGSVGGEVYMNASANNQAISDSLVCATCYSKENGVIKLTKDELNFAYRSSRCQNENLIVLQSEFELTKKPKENIQKQMEENLLFRKNHQPSLALPNCGSIFKNPKNDSAGRLLDTVGAKNMMQGGVKVWDNHANFIVNFNNGTSFDVLSLMYKMYQAVKKEYNIELEPEIRFLGENNEKENELCQILYRKKQK